MTVQDLEDTRKKIISSLKIVRAGNPLLARRLLGVKVKNFIRTFEKAPVEEPKLSKL